MSHELYIKYKHNPIIVYQPEEAVHVDKVSLELISFLEWFYVKNDILKLIKEVILDSA